MIYEKSSYHRKWWVKTIRERNYFGHRYWWFNWSLLLGCIIAFYFSYNYLKEDTDQTCLNRNNLSRRIDGVNDALDDCCACQDSVLAISSPPPIPEAPPIPEDAIPCHEGNKSANGSNTPKEYNFEMGTSAGNVRLCYDTGNTYPDEITITYNGIEIFTTGNVVTNGTRCSTFNYPYSPGKPKHVTLKVDPSGNSDTEWSFDLDCPN